MNQSLKIAPWSENGLAQHSLEVKAFLKIYDLDILLISKTHIPNFTMYLCTMYLISPTCTFLQAPETKYVLRMFLTDGEVEAQYNNKK